MTNNSAVVVLHEQVTDSLILTERNINLRHHPGEICFPGGRWDSGDEDLWTTALRELHEELGIEASRVHLVKALLPEETRIGSMIYPWLATISTMNPYIINESEVASVLTLPMQAVITPENYRDVVVHRYGLSFVSSQFVASDHFVWGATARIMKQLCFV